MLRNVARLLNKNLLTKNNRYYSKLQENEKSDYEIHNESCMSLKCENLLNKNKEIELKYQELKNQYEVLNNKIKEEELQKKIKEKEEYDKIKGKLTAWIFFILVAYYCTK